MKNIDTLRPADYLILDALSRRPLTAKEISQKAGLSWPTIRERLRKFEKLKLVVKGQNNKWSASLVLWVASAEDITEVVTGKKVVKMYTPKEDLPPEPTIEAGRVVSPSENAPESPQEPPGEALGVVPDLTPPPPVPEQYKVPKPTRRVSELAEKLATRMNIPSYLEGRGEVAMGAVQKCVLCPRTSPIQYGKETVCPMCARGGR